MEDRTGRFFGWVWRINGLLVLGVGLAGVALVLFAVSETARFRRERPDAKLTQVAGEKLPERELRLADFEAIDGTRFLYAALRGPDEDSYSSGRGYRATRNLLFFDTEAKRAHWLLPSSDQELGFVSFLRHDLESNGRERRQTVGILIEIVRESGRSLALASPTGRAVTPVAEPVEGVLGHHLLREDALLVFYVSNGDARVLDVDPTTRLVRSDTSLAAGS